jgi:RNA polymerase sigma-70 factor (ECF subfamily)
MDGSRQARELLDGTSETVDNIRGAIERVVARFHLPEGWDGDLIQEALGRVYLAVILGRFRGAASLATFAENVARYTCLEHLRRQRHKWDLSPERLSSKARWSQPEERLLRLEEHRQNLRTFASLPSESRELLTLLFVEDLSYREIAERTGLTESAIRSRVHRCRLAARAKKERVRSKTPRPGPGLRFSELV